MRRRGGMWCTIVIGVVIGALTSGCGAMGNPPQPLAAQTCPGNNPPFPCEQLWCFNTASTPEIEKLGQQIMAIQNPYCLHPQSGSTACSANDATTWPRELTNVITWKYLTEFDFGSKPWLTPAGPVNVERRMRIPYLIGHTVAQHHKRPAPPSAQAHPPDSLSRENLLIGYEITSGPYDIGQEWEDVTSCDSQADSIGYLAQFVVINMKAASDTKFFYVKSWNNSSNLTAYPSGSSWWFRGANISVDYSFTFPVITKDSAGNPHYGKIWVGYEGGGAY